MENEMVGQNKTELTAEQMQAVFQILLYERPGGRLALKKKTIDTFPKEILFTYEYDEINEVWYFKMPQPNKKRKRQPIKKKKKIVTPDRRILVPGDF